MFTRASNFDKLLDKATSNLRLDTDWPTILQICDLIRQNDCTPKYAVAAIKKKLYSPNPHQAMFALLVMESIVKNCGSSVHDEIASKTNCEMFRDLVKTSQHENVRTKILELIQAWAFAFRNTPKYRAVQDTVNIMKAEGYKFPPLKESDAMFSADCAPEWSDGDVCHRCRVPFSLMMRKHHCRACGQVFCQQCSSKTSTIPKFGIEKEVRVCDACFDKVSRPPSAAAATAVAKPDSADTTSDYGAGHPPLKRAGTKTAEELQEEEELQLALALSQSEAEQKEKERKRPLSAATSAPPAPPAVHHNVSPSPSSVSASPEHTGATDSELSRYLDRNYWEQRREAAPAATAPSEHPNQARVDSSPSDKMMGYNSIKPVATLENGAADAELEEFVAALKSQIEIFVNRMKSDSSRGRSITNDTSVQTLFMNITAMHSRLLRYIQLQDDKRVHYESLQDKVAQTRDSRAALDTLRAEHAARLAAAAEAAERQRQLQMAHKLQTMRKKKHEYLQYQRQLALQRVQEQEREMQMRQEQQKQQYLMSAGGPYYMPGAPVQYPGFHSQPVYPNPQFHQMVPHSVPDGTSGQPQQSMNQQPTISQPSAMMGQQMTAIHRAGVPQSAPLTPAMMQQLRMSMPVVHNMMQASLPNGPPGQQNVPQHNQANPQVGKQPGAQTLPSMGNPLQLAQNMGSINPGGQMVGVHGQMPGMRMPPGAQMQMQQQLGPQGQPQGVQMPMPNQMQGPPMTVQGQMPPQPGQSIPQQTQQMPPGHQVPQGQTMPAQGQPMPNQSQPIPGQGHPMPNQSQHMPNQGQPMPNQGQQMQNQGQQMQNQGQPMHTPLQQMPQGQQAQGPGMGGTTTSIGTPHNFAGASPPHQAMQSVSHSSPASVPASAPAPVPASAPAPASPKHENPTAELISFD